ncbi:protein kinase [Spirillospora sp. NPDC047279]|uniref:protein kinase n=1 Tax=Spirillospora sp. NPDC047279 TaxID=3155478 RepID=UPI0033C0DF7F
MSKETIGQYRLLSRLGGGDAHRATSPAGRDVAIRLLPAEARERLRLDLPRMCAVRSPYVVDVLDGEPDADPPYVVTRFVPGRPLPDVIAAEGPLTGRALHRLALDLAKALAAIHERDLAHRALRPRDVLVVDGSPVIVDFALEALVPPSADIRAWSAVVTHAAGGEPPESLHPLLAKASADTGLTAQALVEALTPLIPTPRTTEPTPLTRTSTPHPPATPPNATVTPSDTTATPSGAAALPLDVVVAPGDAAVVSADATATPASVSVASPDVAAASADAAAGPAGGSATPAGSATSVASAGGIGGPGVARVAAGFGVAESWARLLTAMVVVIAAGMTVMVPVLGIVGSVAAVVVLRALTRNWAAAAGRTLVSLPYAGAVGAAVTLGLASVSAVGVEVDPLAACGLGAGAGVAALWAAPGVTGPRRGMESLLGSVARTPRVIAAAGVLLGAAAFLAAVGAISLTTSFAPMYGLQSSLESAVGQVQTRLG